MEKLKSIGLAILMGIGAFFALLSLKKKNSSRIAKDYYDIENRSAELEKRFVSDRIDHSIDESLLRDGEFIIKGSESKD